MQGAAFLLGFFWIAVTIILGIKKDVLLSSSLKHRGYQHIGTTVAESPVTAIKHIITDEEKSFLRVKRPEVIKKLWLQWVFVSTACIALAGSLTIAPGRPLDALSSAIVENMERPAP